MSARRYCYGRREQRCQNDNQSKSLAYFDTDTCPGESNRLSTSVNQLTICLNNFISYIHECKDSDYWNGDVVRQYKELVAICMQAESYTPLERAHRVVFYALSKSEPGDTLAKHYEITSLVISILDVCQTLLNTVDRHDFVYSFYFAPDQWYKANEIEFEDFTLPVMFYIATIAARQNNTQLLLKKSPVYWSCHLCEADSRYGSFDSSLTWHEFQSLFPKHCAKQTDLYAFLIDLTFNFGHINVFPKNVCFSDYVEREDRLPNDKYMLEGTYVYKHIVDTDRLTKATWIAEVRKWIKFEDFCEWTSCFPTLSLLFGRIAPFPFKHAVIVQLLEVLKRNLNSDNIETLICSMIDEACNSEKDSVISESQRKRIDAIVVYFGYRLAQMSKVLFKLVKHYREYFLDIVKKDQVEIPQHLQTALNLYIGEEEVETEDITQEVWCCLYTNANENVGKFMGKLLLAQAVVFCPKLLFSTKLAFKQQFPTPPVNWTQHKWKLFFDAFFAESSTYTRNFNFSELFDDVWAREIIQQCIRTFSDDTPQKILDCFQALHFDQRDEKETLLVHETLLDEFVNKCTLTKEQFKDDQPLFCCNETTLYQTDSLSNVSSANNALLQFAQVIANVELLCLKHLFEEEQLPTNTEDSSHERENKNSKHHRFFFCCFALDAKVTHEMIESLPVVTEIATIYQQECFESLFVALLATKVSDGNSFVDTRETKLSLHLLTQCILEVYGYKGNEAPLLVRLSALLNQMTPPCGLSPSWQPLERWLLSNRTLWKSSLVCKKFVDSIVPKEETANDWFELALLYATTNEGDNPVDFSHCKSVWTFLSKENHKRAQKMFFATKPTESLLAIGPWSDITVFDEIHETDLSIKCAEKMITLYEGSLNDLKQICLPIFETQEANDTVPAIVRSVQAIDDQLWSRLLQIAPASFFTKQCCLDALIDSNQTYKTCLFLQTAMSSNSSTHKTLKLSSNRTNIGSLKSDVHSSTCSVCLLQKATHAAVPCGHMCLCQKCLSHADSDLSHCPICRKNIDAVYKIYFS